MRLFATILICLILSGCGLRSFFKIQEALESESVSPSSFKQEIPFRDEQGLLIIEVSIDNKVYNFIFDSGGSTMLDDDIVEAMNYEKIGTRKHRGTTRKKKTLKTIKLDGLSIGNVRFSSIVAGITDLDALKQKTCLNFDGIIGANVMNKAIWQIDYARKVIVLTSSRDSLHHPADAKSIDFSATGKGTPMLSISINGKYVGEAQFDTGSNGGIDLPQKDIAFVDSASAFIVKHGLKNGVFADKLESSRTTIVPKFKIGYDFEIDSTLATFNKVLPYALIGNKFMRNYVVTIDWIHQEIILSSFKPSKERRYHTFGFTPSFKDGHIVIGSIYENSPADLKGLKINDQIVQINGLDLSDSNYVSYCELLHLQVLKSNTELTITVRRADKEITQVLTKQDLIMDVLGVD